MNIFKYLAVAVILSLPLGLAPRLFAEQAEPESGENIETAGPEKKPFAPVFTFDKIVKIAEEAAARPFQAPDPQLSGFLRELGEEEWNRVKFLQDKRLWSGPDQPFEADFFHPGFIYDQPVAIDVVEEGLSRRLPFRADFFQPAASFGKEPPAPLNYAGFRLFYPFNSPDRADELLSFLGATHFRALARGAGYGLTARALIINPASPDGEEFPYFRRFWLLKPEDEAVSLTVYALMESPSLTGAYSFLIRPGTSAVMDVEARLFLRAGASRPRKIGLAPAGSMYLFSEKENGSRSDYRPELHNSDTLLFSSGPGAWFNRPLNNPERLELDVFPLNSPKGFGLMQNDAVFDHYQDLRSRFDLRPSLWIEPAGDWGPGHIELIEIPSAQEIHDNILAFWVSDQPDPPESPEGSGGGELLSFAYRLYWMNPGALPHQLGRVAATRQNRVKGDSIRFLLDFEGEELNSFSADTGLASVVEAEGKVVVSEKKLLKNPVTGGWRLEFKVSLPQDSGVVQSLMTARGERRGLRLKAFLKKGENLSEALTETWLYDLPY